MVAARKRNNAASSEAAVAADATVVAADEPAETESISNKKAKLGDEKAKLGDEKATSDGEVADDVADDKKEAEETKLTAEEKAAMTFDTTGEVIKDDEADIDSIDADDDSVEVLSGNRPIKRIPRLYPPSIAYVNNRNRTCSAGISFASALDATVTFHSATIGGGALVTQLNALMHKKENKAKMLQSANNIISKLVSPALLGQCIEDESFSVLEYQTTYPDLVLYPPVSGVEKFMGFACAGGWIYHCIKNEASPITAAELVQNGYLVPFLKEDRVQMKGFLGGWQFGKLKGHKQKACFMKNSENKNDNNVAAKSPKTSAKKALISMKTCITKSKKASGIIQWSPTRNGLKNAW